MTWRTHAAGGVASLWLLAPLPALLTGQVLTGQVLTGQALTGQEAGVMTGIGTMAAAAALGALLPDLDAARSKLSAVRVAGTQPLLPLAQTLNGLFGHRGLLHSLPGLALFALAVALPLAFWWGAGPSLALVLGYASHLALDAGTVHGIPLLPAKGKDGRWGMGRMYHLPPRRLRVVTGSPAEDAVFLPLALAATLLVLRALL